MGQLNRGDLKSKNRNFNNILDSMLNLADSDAQTITSAVTLSSTLGVTGATTLPSTLDVTGAATFRAQGNIPRRLTTLVTGSFFQLGVSGPQGEATGSQILTASAADSGRIFIIPSMAAAAAIQLPAAAGAVGATYKFVLIGDTCGADFDITTNGSEKILGAVPKGDGDNVAASDANDSVGFDANATSGSMFSVTCISATAGTAFIAHDIIEAISASTATVNLK